MMCHLSRTTATISIDPNGPCHSSSIFQLAFIGLVPENVRFLSGLPRHDTGGVSQDSWPGQFR